MRYTFHKTNTKYLESLGRQNVIWSWQWVNPWISKYGRARSVQNLHWRIMLQCFHPLLGLGEWMKTHTMVMIIFQHKETRRSTVARYAFNLPHISLSAFPPLPLMAFYFSPSSVMSLRHMGRCGIFQVDTRRDGMSTLIEQLIWLHPGCPKILLEITQIYF